MSTSPTATQVVPSQQAPKKTRLIIKLVVLSCVILVPIALFTMIAIALVVPKISGNQGRAKVDAAKSDEATLASELHEFKLDCGRYPTASEGLGALIKRPPDLEFKWKGPYSSKFLPIDPWGRDYVYRAGAKGHYSLVSYGQDGAPGGMGLNADIVEDE